MFFIVSISAEKHPKLSFTIEIRFAKKGLYQKSSLCTMSIKPVEFPTARKNPSSSQSRPCGRKMPSDVQGAAGRNNSFLPEPKAGSPLSWHRDDKGCERSSRDNLNVSAPTFPAWCQDAIFLPLPSCRADGKMHS